MMRWRGVHQILTHMLVLVTLGEAELLAEKIINNRGLGASVILDCNDTSLTNINWDGVTLSWSFTSRTNQRTEMTSDTDWFYFRPAYGFHNAEIEMDDVTADQDGVYFCEITGFNSTQTSHAIRIELVLVDGSPEDAFDYTNRVVMGVIAMATVLCLLLSVFLIWNLSGKTEQEENYYSDKSNWGRGMTRMDVAHDFWTRYSYDNIAVDASNLSISRDTSGGSSGRPLEIRPSRHRSPGHRSPGQRKRNASSLYSERGIEVPPPGVDYHTNPGFDDADDKSSTV